MVRRRQRRAASDRVAQVVERDLLVADIDDRRGVGVTPLLRRCFMHHRSHGEIEARVERRQRLPVAPGQVVVDRDDMHPAARQPRHGSGQRRGKGLALPRLHLHQPAAEHRRRAHHLHVVRPHPERRRRGFPCQGERPRDGRGVEPAAQLGGAGRGAPRLDGRFSPATLRRNPCHHRPQPAPSQEGGAAR